MAEIVGVPIENESQLKKFWNNEFERCEELMDERRNVWRKARKSYRMALYNKDEDDGARKRNKKQFVRNPILYTNVTILVSNLAAQKPVIIAKAKFQKDDPGATMVSAALDYYSEKCDLYSILKYGVMDASLDNIAIAKIGYNMVPTYMLEGNAPFITRVSPYNFLFDPDATCTKNARWMGEKNYLPVQYLRDNADEFMNIEEAIKMAGTFRVNEEIDEDQMQTDERSSKNYTTTVNLDEEDYPNSPSLEQRVPVVEIYDRVNRQILLFAGDCSVLISRRPYPDYIKDFPYAVMMFNFITDYMMGPTDFEVIYDKIKEINILNNRILEHTKRMLSKYVTRKGAFTKADMDKMVEGKMGGVIEAETQGPLGDVIMPLPSAPLDNNNWNSLEQLKASLNEDTGISDFQRSQPLQEKRTATELSMIQQAAGVRGGFRQKQVDMWLEEIATKLFYVLKATMDAPQWIDVSGNYPLTSVDENGQTMVLMDEQGRPVLNRQSGFMLNPDVLQAEFRIKIEAGSTAAATSGIKQNQLMQLTAMAATVPFLNQVAIWQQLLTNMGLDATELIIPPQMQPPGPPMKTPDTPSGEIRPPKSQLEGVVSGNNIVGDMKGVPSA